MLSKRFILTLIAAIAALALACGNGGSPSTPSASSQSTAADFPQTIQQTDGQAVTIATKPQRIVSLDAHATEIFCAVGAADQLVAVDKYANCPLGSSAKPALDAFQPSLEAIAGYRPDLVYTSANGGDIVTSLRRLNIPVIYIVNPTSLSGVLDHINTLAAASGHAAEGKKLTASMQTRMDGIKSKLAAVSQGPRVYHELDNTLYSAAPNSFVGDFYTFLKAQNIAAGAASAYPQLSAEVIVQRNPEVIVLADEAAGISANDVKSRPGWGVIDAVKNNRICVVDPDIVSRAGPRIVDALDTLAKCIYPDIFK
ncbi:MAG TPA: ABC transporter substrate-binding protein [Dehalococcoidia bacterium]